MSDPAERALADGRALLEIGRAEEALTSLGHAVAAEPADPYPHALIARALLELERNAEARDEASTAISLDPESEWPHRLLALALLGLGRSGEARDAALTAVSLDPEGSLAYAILADALSKCGDQAGAIEAARHAVALEPDAADSHYALGCVELRNERWSEAEKAFRQTLSLDPEHHGALNDLGVSVQRQGRREEAMPLLESAARVDPRSRTVRGNLIVVGRGKRPFGLLLLSFLLLLISISFLGSAGETGNVVYFSAAVTFVGALALAVLARKRWSALSPATRTLVSDDARARRFKPQRWEWSKATRLRPWWWTMLRRVPPPKALAINAALFALALGRAVHHPAQESLAIVPLVLGAALPFSVIRAWRWWRLQHPGRESWRGPDSG